MSVKKTLDISSEQLKELKERIAKRELVDSDYELLQGLTETIECLSQRPWLKKKPLLVACASTSWARLRKQPKMSLKNKIQMGTRSKAAVRRKNTKGMVAIQLQTTPEQIGCTLNIQISKAAQGDVIHNDDTTMKILNFLPDQDADNKLVEPNSGLGKAINYLQNHWEKLTRLLTAPGAPLDNNICERALKQPSCIAKMPCFTRRSAGPEWGICL